MEAAAKQAVGSKYVLESMKYAQGKTWEVVNRLAQRVQPWHAGVGGKGRMP